jgi:hypothetical protein
MLLKTLGAILIIVMVSLLVMLSAQETFKDVLEPLGLYHLEGGIFTDCLLPENRHKKYCEPQESPQHKDWKSVKDGSGFDLTE